MAPYALPQNHHARTVAGFIKGDVHRQSPAGKGVCKKCHPRAAQNTTRLRTDDLHVQLRMINVADFKRPIPVTQRGPAQRPTEWLMHVGGPAPLSCYSALKLGSLFHRLAEQPNRRTSISACVSCSLFQ